MEHQFNSRIYRKMKQAEKNFYKLMFIGGRYKFGNQRRNRRTKYWANQYRKWLDKLLKQKLYKWEKINANL